MWFSQEGDSFHVTPDSFIYLMIIAIKIQKGNISVEKKKKKDKWIFYQRSSLTDY